MTIGSMYNDTHVKEKRRELRKNFTDAERKLWNQLRGKKLENLQWYRQYSVGGYILDFYCPQVYLCVELDGGQHAESDNELHDRVRTEFLRKRGIKVLRFWNNDALKNIEGVVEKIRDEIQAR